MTRRVVAASLVSAVGVVLLSGCVSPAGDSTSFSDKAATTAEAAASEVATVRLTTQLLLDGRLQRNYAEVTISASEDALSSIAQSFSVVEPADGPSDQVRAEVEALLGKASDAVAAARSAGRRDNRAAMTQAVQDLETAAKDLEAAGENLG